MGLLMAAAGSGADSAPRTDPARLEKHVRFLTALSPARHHLNTRSLNAAADHIEEHFQSLGWRSERQSYEVNGRRYHNVRAFRGPVGAPRIVLGAHYDVAGDQPGADDNASGVAGLLELARALVERRPNLVAEIELVAYTLEEPPYFRTERMGSAVHAQSLKDEKVDVLGMISLEMIGYFSDRRGSQRYPLPGMGWIYPSKGNFIAVVGNWASGAWVRRIKRGMRRGTTLPVVSLSAPNALEAIGLSDQRNYWARGYPALMVTDTSFFRNPHYHRSTDTADTLDYGRMAQAVDGLAHAVVRAAEGPSFPMKKSRRRT